jgi:hypothetical protein
MIQAFLPLRTPHPACGWRDLHSTSFDGGKAPAIKIQTLLDLTILLLKMAQYSETNVMHFLFNLLGINPLNAELNPICHLPALSGAHHILHVSRIRVNGLYMFRELLANPHEALHNRHLVYCVGVMAVGCTRVEVFNPGAANCYNKHAIYQVPLVECLLRMSK